MPRTDFVRHGLHALLAPLLSFGRRCLTASLGVSLVLPRFGTPRAFRWPQVPMLPSEWKTKSSSTTSIYGTRPMREVSAAVDVNEQ